MMKFTTSFSSFILPAVLSMAAVVKGNTPLPDSFVQSDLANNSGYEIAFASRPLWHFGQLGNNKPCYPVPAFDSVGRQYGVNPTPWPNANAGCPDPGPKGTGKPFPTYFTVTSCNPNEIRVAYNLYFQKDGFSNVIIAKGHMHDWERIIVIWRKSTDGLWRRSELLKSFHSGYTKENWGDVQNTIEYPHPEEQGGKNKDGAKIYVGWAKHAMFSTRNTGWNDPFSQGCSREFRSNDWWFLPQGRETLVAAGRDTVIGGKIASVDWGSATSNPVVVEGKVCGESEGGFTACALVDELEGV